MQTKTRLLSTLALSLLTVAGHASATTIQTSSYSSWVASLNSSPSEANLYFGSSSYSTPTGFSTTVGSYGTFTVTGPDNGGYLLNQVQGYGPSGNITGLVGPTDGTGTTASNGISISAPGTGVTAILLGLGLTGNSSDITVTLSDGETFSVTPAVNGNVLLGLSSSTPITAVFLSSDAGSAVVLDDLYAGVSNIPPDSPSSATSECATILFISGGLLFIGAKRKIFSNITAAQA